MPDIGRSSTAAALPAGGGGQALRKVTATDYSLGWITATAGGGPVYTSGLWFDNRYTADTSNLTDSLAPNTSVYAPVWLSKSVTINALGVMASSPNSTGCQLGVYTYSGGVPATLNGSVGVALTNTVLARTAAISAVTLPAGWSVLALGNSSSVDYLTFNRTVRGYITPIGQSGPSGPNVGFTFGWTAATGTLSSLPTVTASNPVPTLYFKVA